MSLFVYFIIYVQSSEGYSFTIENIEEYFEKFHRIHKLIALENELKSDYHEVDMEENKFLKSDYSMNLNDPDGEILA